MSASGMSRLSSTHWRVLLHVWSVSNLCLVSFGYVWSVSCIYGQSHACMVSFMHASFELVWSVLSLCGQCWVCVVSLKHVWSALSLCGQW